MKNETAYSVAGAVFALVAVLCWHWGYTAGTIVTGILSIAYMFGEST